MGNKLVRVSKFLSLILRHKPEKIGLQLGQGGWVSVADLIDASQQSKIPLTPTLLQTVVATNDKQRFSFSADGLYIRANHGHSVAINLDLKPMIPPSILFHGTATRFLKSIKQNGLIAKQRNYVHLSMDEATAKSVGTRHGEVVILTVLAAQMIKDGFEMYCSASSVWLTKKVPVAYIVFPEN